MFALKMFCGPPTRFVVCACKPWSFSSAGKNFRGQHSVGAEIQYSLPKKVDLSRFKLTCTTLWNVDQSSSDFFCQNTGGIVLDQVSFRFFDTLSRSGDTRDQIRKSCKSARNFAGFWP